MQRQSLGSPSSKLVKEERHPSQPSSSSASTVPYGQASNEEEEEEAEQIKKLNPKNAPPQNYIHLIPILTLLCFLILYLSSHHPSITDLAEFNGVKAFSNINESHENSISELQRILEIEKSDILAVRSLKQEANTGKHRRLNRKFAHY